MATLRCMLIAASIIYSAQSVPSSDNDASGVQRIELIDKGSYMLVPSSLDPESDPNVIKILCISDTHNFQRKLHVPDLPYADIIINAGDMTMLGTYEELKSYDDWIFEYLHRHRKAAHSIVIPGNRDQTLHSQFYKAFGYKRRGTHSGTTREKEDTAKCQEAISKNSIYLKDDMVTLYGLNIYGTPWTASYEKSPWAFQARRDGERLKRIYKKIPKSVDILITHGPPHWHGDYASIMDSETKEEHWEHAGEEALLRRVETIGGVKAHIFAHIHEGYGVTKQDGLNTVFVNSAMVDKRYKDVNKPIMIYVQGQRQETLHDELR